ncbi:MAG: hypothetical protein HY711_11685, partial [Candidatus Melainabacteria bacterium]|nr:hypothetical protein [Candidatus Melainabacteria bacterium]
MGKSGIHNWVVDNSAGGTYHVAHRREINYKLSITSRQWLLNVLLVALLILVQGLVQGFAFLPTYAGEFPGKGSYQAWLKANKFYNVGNRFLNAGKYEEAIAQYK